jgi:hypothetical protein
MDVYATIKVAKSTLGLAKGVAALVKKADKNSDVTKRVLLYLKAAQGVVHALGVERQQILSDATLCDINDPAQIKALRKRLHIYLYEDNFRSSLVNSIRGLDSCREAI